MQPLPQPPITADQVRNLYGIRPVPDTWKYLGNAGGFSGAVFWRLTEPQLGPLVLRIWPAKSPVERIRWVHAALRHVYQHGVTFVPVPLLQRTGDTVFDVDERLAELAPWLPGTANFCERPHVTRLRGAMRALAQLHVALSSFETHPPRVAPGLLQRRDRWQALIGHGIGQLLQASAHQSQHALNRFVTGLAHSVVRSQAKMSEQLDRMANIMLPLQVCVRDVWHDHLLFVEDKVSGIVDFDALRVDSVCLDVVRLLQSLVGNDDSRWQEGLAAYQQLRPLTGAEHELLPLLRQLNPILSVCLLVAVGAGRRPPFRKLGGCDPSAGRLVQIDAVMRGEPQGFRTDGALTRSGAKIRLGVSRACCSCLRNQKVTLYAETGVVLRRGLPA